MNPCARWFFGVRKGGLLQDLSISSSHVHIHKATLYMSIASCCKAGVSVDAPATAGTLDAGTKRNGHLLQVNRYTWLQKVCDRRETHSAY